MGGRKRSLAAVLALFATLAVALGLATPALAATITINQPEEGHSYSAYQVLSADVSEGEDHSNVRLSNVQWGKDVDGDALLSLLKGNNEVGNTYVTAATTKGGQKGQVQLKTLYKDATTAADFAAIFDWASDNTALADTIAGIINNPTNNIIKSNANPVPSTWVPGTGTTGSHYTLSISSPGYYFIRDGVSSANHYFMQIFNDDKTVAPKASTPTSEKKVYENTKSRTDGGYGMGFNDTADYSIGDQVPFKIIGTIPEMSAYNNGYEYQFEDTLSTSLTRPNSSDVKVYIAKNKNDVYIDANGNFATQNNAKDVTGDFSVTMPTTNNSMTIAVSAPANSDETTRVNDLRKVTDVYDGKNDDGSDKRTDYQYLIVAYKATLNQSAAVGQETIPGNSLGDLHKDNNVDLGNVNGARLVYSNNPNTPSTHGNTTPDYVIVFTYKTDLTKASADSPNSPLSGAIFHLKNSKNQIAVINSSSHKFIRWIDDENTALEVGETIALTSGNDGKFGVSGLDDGTYTLQEITPPVGHNLAGNTWTITISANTSNGQNGNGDKGELKTIATDLTGGKKAVSYDGSSLVGVSQDLVLANSVQSDVAKGSLSATITNTQGFQLPQTGGTGTIALTIVGVILAAGAIIGLSIRKRANDEQ